MLAGTKTEGDWKIDAVAPNQQQVEQMLVQFLEEYPDLKKEEYQHKKEQLYLMISWGFKEREIHLLLDSPISSLDIDFFRLMVFLLGFDFVKENLLGNKFYYEDAIEMALEKLVQRKYPVVSEMEQLKIEKENLQKEFHLRMEFLQDRLDSEKKIYTLENNHEMELLKKDFEYQKGELHKEILALEKENETLHTNNETLLSTNETLHTTIRNGENLAGKGQLIHEKFENKQTPLGWLLKFKKKEQEQRHSLIIEIMKNTSFSTEQLKILNYAFEIGLPEKCIREMAVPELPLMNLIMLVKFFMKSKGIVGEIPKVLENDAAKKPGIESKERVEEVVEENVAYDSMEYQDMEEENYF